MTNKIVDLGGPSFANTQLKTVFLLNCLNITFQDLIFLNQFFLNNYKVVYLKLDQSNNNNFLCNQKLLSRLNLNIGYFYKKLFTLILSPFTKDRVSTKTFLFLLFIKYIKVD
jgi:hypothetical protein